MLKFGRMIEPVERPKQEPFLLDREDVRRLEQRLPYEKAVSGEQLLQAGHQCYALRNDAGEIETLGWIASGENVYTYELGRDLWVPEDVAYFFDGFTFAEVRGRGAMSHLLKGIMAILSNSRPAVEWFEAWAERSNKSSVRSLEKAGLRFCGSWRIASVGPLRLCGGEPWVGRREQA